MKISQERADQIVAAAIELEDASRAFSAGDAPASALEIAREHFEKVSSNAYDEAIAA